MIRNGVLTKNDGLVLERSRKIEKCRKFPKRLAEPKNCTGRTQNLVPPDSSGKNLRQYAFFTERKTFEF